MTDPKNVKVDDLMLFKYWGRVNRAYTGELGVTNVDTGESFQVRGVNLVERADSADFHSTIKKVSKTQAAEILVGLHNVPFTVTFDKADGTERTLRGRLVSSEHLLGRSMVEDLDIDRTKHRLRKVDHRTIKSIVANGVKYVVK